MAKGYWTHSKSEKKAFSNAMKLIDQFCIENNIEHVEHGGSYKFELNGKKYIVTNSSLPKELRLKGVTYFFAGQTRLIQIYSDLKAGRRLDNRGRRLDGVDDE